MVDKLERMTHEQRANFVAYLDGELPDEESQQIEHLLARNEVARHDMESLATVWELLDTLPRTKAPDDFAEKTIATLKLDEQKQPVTEAEWFKRTVKYSLNTVVWIAVALCGAAGFLVARSFPASNNDELIHNYDLLINLDDYREVGSIEFLKKLQNSPVWANRDGATSSTADSP